MVGGGRWCPAMTRLLLFVGIFRNVSQHVMGAADWGGIHPSTRPTKLPLLLSLRGGKRGKEIGGTLKTRKRAGQDGWQHFAGDEVMFRYEHDDFAEEDAPKGERSQGGSWKPPPPDKVLDWQRLGAASGHRAGRRKHHGRQFNDAKPVYWQVCEQLKLLKNVRSVLDVGCGNGVLLNWINVLCPNITKYAGIDHHKPVVDNILQRFSSRPPLKVVLSPRGEALRVVLLHGNVTSPDERLKNLDVITVLNVLEHLGPAEVEQLPAKLFGDLRPRHVLIVVSEAAHNSMQDDTQTNHLEWSEEFFDRWCAQACSSFPVYRRERIDIERTKVRPCRGSEAASGGGGVGGGGDEGGLGKLAVGGGGGGGEGGETGGRNGMRAADAEGEGQARQPGMEKGRRGWSGQEQGGGRQLAVLFSLEDELGNGLEEEIGNGDTARATYISRKLKEEARMNEQWMSLTASAADHDVFGGRVQERAGFEFVGQITLKDYLVVGKRGLSANGWID